MSLLKRRTTGIKGLCRDPNRRPLQSVHDFGVVCTVTDVRKQLVKGINGDGPLG